VRTRATSARQVARDAARRLEQAGVPEPSASAEVLLSELLGIGRGEIALYERPLTGEQAALYGVWISRRLEREPVQRILGYAYFRLLKLDLNEDTLIPRPDSESVAGLALERLDLRGGSCRVLEVGTGSGAIAISIARERPLCEVHATDVSEAALEIARRNTERNGATVRFHRADVVSGLQFLNGTVDLLVSNPPYVGEPSAGRLAPEVREWDPPAALYSGADEYSFFKRIFAETPPLLADGADVVLEVGDGQAEAVLDLGGRAGFAPLGIRPDLAGTPRAVLLRWER
jgi:release factor glutamine methyltransferase